MTEKQRKNSLKNLKSGAEVKADYERLTDEQKHERMSKLGKASAQKKRDNRTLKEIALQLMGEEARPEALSQYNLPEGTSNGVVMMVAAYIKAQAGDIKAQEYIRDTAGQMPTKEINLAAEVITEADRKLLDKVAERIKERTEKPD